MKSMDIYIITGRSGSGKSTAVNAFEDAGYYCVDNMPVALLPKFLELPLRADGDFAGLAFVMDLREKSFIQSYHRIFSDLRNSGYHFTILFLEAGDEVLLRRYNETRRHHPLAKGQTLIESIQAEARQLRPLRDAADKIIDTSECNVHQLKSTILRMLDKGGKRVPMRIAIISFGFKFGPPSDADLVMDVRFLPNPYFVPHLKPLSGEDEAVRNFIFHHEETQDFLNRYLGLLDFLIPMYEKEGKAYLTIGIGCTGGRHRSVAIARAVFDHLRKHGTAIEISHRDIGK